MAWARAAEFTEQFDLLKTKRFQSLSDSLDRAIRESKAQAAAKGMLRTGQTVAEIVSRTEAIIEEHSNDLLTDALDLVSRFDTLTPDSADWINTVFEAHVRGICGHALQQRLLAVVKQIGPPQLAKHAVEVSDRVASRVVSSGALAVRTALGEKRLAGPTGPPPAERDHLTDLLPRKAFDSDLAQAASSASAGEPASLIMADIDLFKRVNDTHGHQTGDAVLQEVARRLRRATAGKGHAYRYGGEAFVVLLPNHTTEEALAVAERARRAIERERINDIAVTSSFGVATLLERATDPAGWLKAADDAMYEAKRQGRNQVRLASGSSAASGHVEGAPPPDDPAEL